MRTAHFVTAQTTFSSRLASHARFRRTTNRGFQSVASSELHFSRCTLGAVNSSFPLAKGSRFSTYAFKHTARTCVASCGSHLENLKKGESWKMREFPIVIYDSVARGARRRRNVRMCTSTARERILIGSFIFCVTHVQ